MRLDKVCLNGVFPLGLGLTVEYKHMIFSCKLSCTEDNHLMERFLYLYVTGPLVVNIRNGYINRV